MEKRPPANVGDLERQREKHVHLLGVKGGRSPAWKGADSPQMLLGLPPSSFLLVWDMKPLPHSLSKCLLSFYSLPSRTGSKRDVKITTVF